MTIIDLTNFQLCVRIGKTEFLIELNGITNKLQYHPQFMFYYQYALISKIKNILEVRSSQDF